MQDDYHHLDLLKCFLFGVNLFIRHCYIHTYIILYISAVPVHDTWYLFLEFVHIQPQTLCLLAHIQWVVPKAPLYHHYTDGTLK